MTPLETARATYRIAREREELAWAAYRACVKATNEAEQQLEEAERLEWNAEADERRAVA